MYVTKESILIVQQCVIEVNGLVLYRKMKKDDIVSKITGSI